MRTFPETRSRNEQVFRIRRLQVQRTDDLQQLRPGIGAGREKAYFLDLLTAYRDERIPLSAVLTVLESRVIKYGEDYLARQTFFEPYTQALMELSDSDKGRDF
jgi:uncharacterized protein DUF1722